MRVKSEAEVARRAALVRRILRAGPTYRGIEVSVFWLFSYGLAMGLVGVAVSLPLVLAFAEWSVHGGHF